MSDLITDTSRKMGVEPKVIFRKAAEAQRLTNALEAADYRFQRWFKYGEVPEYVMDYALDQWRETCQTPMKQSH